MGKVVLLGWFGNGNLGDEIILECMLSEFRRVDGNTAIVVISDDPKDTERRHGVRSISRRGGWGNRARRLRELLTADLLVLGGGALLGRYGGSDKSVLGWLYPMRLAQALGVPTVTYAVGVSDGLSPEGEEVTRETLSKADRLFVRDDRSIEALRAMGVSASATLTSDPAILLADTRSYQRVMRPREAPRVAVFLRHWYVSENRIPDETTWKAFERNLALCLDSLVEERSAEVVFIPMRVKDPIDDDRVVAREVSGCMAHAHSARLVESEVDSAEILRLVSESDLVIGMRLHSLVVAASLGVPSLAVNYHPKVKSFMDSIGAGAWVSEIPGSNAEELTAKAVRALSGDYPVDEVLSRVDSLKELARAGAQGALGPMGDKTGQVETIRRVFRATRVVISRAAGGG